MINRLCNTLNWGNWNLGFVKLVVWWAERDIVDGRNPTEADRPECKGYENFDTVSN